MECAINGREIGTGSTYIVAEMSGNHNQSFERAVEILKVAKACGADAIKLQTYTADTITVNSDTEYFQVKGGTLWDGYTLYDLYKEAYTPWEWQPELKAIADDIKLDLFSSPFDVTAVDFLENMEVPAYKVASPEVMDHPLLERIARTGKPIIMSTGMATLAELDDALQAIRRIDAEVPVMLLKCTAAYPAPPAEINLCMLPHLRQTFGVPVGLSDHTMGSAVSVASVALGACMIEKHFTLSRADGGPDADFSMEPEEFRQMVEAVRIVEKARGTIHYGPSPKEENPRKYRRSLFIAEDVKAGEILTHQNVRSVRPGQGLHTKYLTQIIGCKAQRDLVRGTPLDWSMVAFSENQFEKE